MKYNKAAYKRFGKEGANKRWAKRLLLIEKLHGFGGIQSNYRKWSTEHLKILLKAWQKQS